MIPTTEYKLIDLKYQYLTTWNKSVEKEKK